MMGARNSSDREFRARTENCRRCTASYDAEDEDEKVKQESIPDRASHVGRLHGTNNTSYLASKIVTRGVQETPTQAGCQAGPQHPQTAANCDANANKHLD